MPGNFVTLKYTAKGMPEHWTKVFRFKQFTFEKGASLDLPDDLAGQVLHSHREAFEVVAGRPKDWVSPNRSPGSTKELVRGVTADPARALDHVEALPEAARKLRAADVEAGKADDVDLTMLAVWAKLGGNAELATAAARRAAHVEAEKNRPKD